MVLVSMAKSSALVPVMTVLLSVSVLLPMLATVTIWAGLVEPFNCPGKARNPFGPSLRITCVVTVAIWLIMYTWPCESTATPVGDFSVADGPPSPSPV